MNQILVTEKLYITPELKRKKLIYKLEFFLSVFLICLLFSYYIYAEYDRDKTEQVSQEILTQMKQELRDTTIKQPNDNDVIIIILDEKQEQQIEEEQQAQTEEPEDNKGKEDNEDKELIDSKEYTSSDGVKYHAEAILNIPSIKVEYTVLSSTSPDLLFVSLNKYHGPNPNQKGNYCIVGHYYESGKMFGKLHKLKNGDTAQLTDLSGRTITYEVYDKFVVEPTNTDCTSQITGGRRELTLITCTNHGKQRQVVKLREVN